MTAMNATHEPRPAPAPRPPSVSGPHRGLRAQRAAHAAGLALAFACVALAWGPVRAQSLAEVSLTTAIASEMHPGVRLPSGSYRALGPGTSAWIGKVRDAQRWTDWEAYVARGLAARLRPAFVHQVATSFAAAGYFEQAREQRNAGAETHTRIVFQNDAGERTLLFLIEGPDELLWLIASSH